MIEYRANIAAAFERATADDLAQGLEWYGLAADIANDLARGYGHDTETVAGVIAALSPMMTWRTNIGSARALIDRHAHSLPYPDAGYGLQRNVAKAWAILEGADPLDVLGGLKVRAFYANILGDPLAVTVDRWAVRIAYGDPAHPGTVTAREYHVIADAFRDAAAQLGITARDLQAATWVYFRRVHGRAGADPMGV
jgi:hypothetical protein